MVRVKRLGKLRSRKRVRQKCEPEKKYLKIVAEKLMLSSAWDEKLTLKQNMKKMGLSLDSNTRIVEKDPMDPSECAFTTEGTACLKKRPLSEEKCKLAARLIAKHAEDFAAMSRDRKVNPKQLTFGQCRKLCKAYEKSGED